MKKDRYKVISKDYMGHCFSIGEIVTITNKGAGADSNRIIFESKNGTRQWMTIDKEVVKIEEKKIIGGEIL